MTNQPNDQQSTPADRGDFGHPAAERMYYPPMYQQPPKKQRRIFRRILRLARRP